MTPPNMALAQASGEPIHLPARTLRKLFTDVSEEHPHKTALVCRHQPADFLGQISHQAGSLPHCLRWTYSQLQAASELFAVKLHSLGVRKGMRMVALLKNGAQYVVGLYASALLGCAFVPINPQFANKPEALQYMMGLSEASVLMAWDADLATKVTHAMGEQLAAKLLAKVICNENEPVPAGWQSMEVMLSCGTPQPETALIEDTRSDLDNLAVVIFTSGTSSHPKGVKQLNRTLVTGVQASSQAMALDSSKIFCCNLPLFHIYGIGYMLNFLSHGGTVVFPADHFDPEATLLAIHDEKPTNLAGVPTMMQAIINQRRTTKASLESLVQVSVAGSMILPETIKQISGGLGVAKIGTSYGMSEASPISMLAYRDLPYKFEGELVSSGNCAPGVRIRICAPESRDVVKREESGELHVGGPHVSGAYLGNVSGSFYEEDGCSWLVTGDQAVMKSTGEVFVLGRYKDLIIRAGENISPASIEAVVDTLPGVSSQVIGVPDEVAGEVPLAIIKQFNEEEIDRDGIYEAVNKKLGDLYIPAEVVAIQDLGLDDFPKTESGKIQKVELRSAAAEWMKEQENDEMGPSGSLVSDVTGQLIQIWSNLLGLSKDRLDPSTHINEMADSITIMRAVNKIKQKLGREMSTQEIVEVSTIQGQAELLESRHDVLPNGTSSPLSFVKRTGPPQVTDIACARGSTQSADQIRSAFQKTTAGMGLSWDEDVEDVVPIWDFGQIMLRRLRAQSWNHRHAWATTNASVQELKSALETALGNQAMLRTVAIQPRDSSAFFVVVRPSERWFRLVITEVDAVDTANDLRSLVLNDPELDFASAPGPLFRAVICSIRATSSAGVVYQAQHSCFDGLSLPNLGEDLRAILDGEKVAALPPRTPYKAFADTLYLHQTGVQAQVDVNFHLQRLRDLSNSKDAFWPDQRAPEWFKGNFDDAPDELVRSRPVLDGAKIVGVEGITKRTQLPGLQRLIQDHGFSAPAVLKTALALLNSHFTNQSNAVFTQYEAGRDWPYLEPWIAERLPNPMDVNGPAFEAVLNNISIHPTETSLQMIQRVHEEQKLITKHAHAPLLAIQQQLGQDGTNLIEIMRRQIFNWLPSLRSMTAMSRTGQSPMWRVQVQSRSDVGILWNCGMIDQHTFQMNASFDDAQLRASEVDEAIERLFVIARWISSPENYEKPIGDCPRG